MKLCNLLAYTMISKMDYAIIHNVTKFHINDRFILIKFWITFIIFVSETQQILFNKDEIAVLRALVGYFYICFKSLRINNRLLYHNLTIPSLCLFKSLK